MSAPISTSGWPSSRRSSSPPAYPLAPATATRFLVMCMTIQTSVCACAIRVTASAGNCRVRPVGRVPRPTVRSAWRRPRLPRLSPTTSATESRRFRDGAGRLRPRGPGARRVPTGTPPTCSGTSREVQWFWGKTIRTRPATAADDDDAGPERPESYDGLLAAFDDYSAGLVAELERGRPGRAGLVVVGRADRRASPSAARRTRR